MGVDVLFAGVLERASATAKRVGRRRERSEYWWGGAFVAVIVDDGGLALALAAANVVGFAQVGSTRAPCAVTEVSGLSIAVAVAAAGRAGVVDAEVGGVEEEGVAVGDVKLFFVAEELLPLFREGRDEATADGAAQCFVLFIRLVELLLS